MRHVAILTLALVLSSVAGASTAETRLHGYVTKGLLTPICRSDEPCTGPADAATLAFTRVDTRAVSRTVTRSTGFYRLAVAPGRYDVSIRGPGLGQALLTPRRVRVVAGIDGRIDFYVDTGIQ
jgi:hypothetical protein